MPVSTRALTSARWDRRIARVWSSMVDASDVDPSGDVVEVGPGFSAKVGLWLAERGFRGTLFLVEPNDGARMWALGRYRRLLPRATLVPVDRSLAEARGAVPRRIDALLMNHVLDDLLLHASVPPGYHETLFASMRPGAACADEVRRAWTVISTNRAALASASASVVEDVSAFCAGVQPRLVVASQYRSWFHAHHALEHVDRVTAPLLARLAERLASAVPALEIRLKGAGADRERWLIGARRPERSADYLPYGPQRARGMSHHGSLQDNRDAL
jgi:hypothetical protein